MDIYTFYKKNKKNCHQNPKALSTFEDSWV